MKKIGRDYRLPRDLENLVVFLFQIPVCCVILNPLAFVPLLKNEERRVALWLLKLCDSKDLNERNDSNDLNERNERKPLPSPQGFLQVLLGKLCPKRMTESDRHFDFLIIFLKCFSSEKNRGKITSGYW